jgi:hypothetical protein
MDTFQHAIQDKSQMLEIERALAAKIGPREAYLEMKRLAQDEIFLNDTYQVNVRRCDTPIGPMLHLSIKRRDREVIRDWRELQEIKNQIVGPEHEGVELFPAESRLVDTANQYHLWVFAATVDEAAFPFGFTERLVSGESDLPDLPRVKQRARGA